MPLSYQSELNPSSTTFTVGFEFLSTADIKAVGKLNSASTWTELAVTNISTTNGTTTCTVADATNYSSNGEVRIYRSSPTSALVDFQNGSRLSESDLDTAYRQGLFAAQEVRENATEAIAGIGPQGPQGPTGPAGPAGTNGTDGTAAVSGTFEPSIAPTSGAFSAVGTCLGFYTKIGNLVHYQCELNVTTNGTASGNIDVTGLPFTSAATGLVHTVNHGRETQINGSTFVTIQSVNTTALVMLGPPFGDGAGYSLNGTYRTQ